MSSSAVSIDDVHATLGVNERQPRWRIRRWRVAVVVAGPVLAIAAMLFWTGGQEAGVQYRTEPVRRGGLTVTVTATGALEPLTQVSVGTEISGVIDTVAVDFNDPVRADQVLATINTDRLSAQANQARAALESSRADVLMAEATVEDARALPPERANCSSVSSSRRAIGRPRTRR